MFFHVPVHLGSPPTMSIWFKYGSQWQIHIFCKTSILSCLPALLTCNSFFGLGPKVKINSAATNTSNKQLKFLCIQKYQVYKWGQKGKTVLKPWSMQSSCTSEKNPQTFKNTWILKISINKHGKMLATGSLS